MATTENILALSNAQDAIKTACPSVNDSSALVAAKCRALMAGYNKLYSGIDYEPLAVEKTYTAPLVNPDTNKSSRTFKIAGKVDVLCRYHGKLVLFDHKTTSQDISDPAGVFWRQQVVEAQPSHYMLLLWLNGIKCDDAVWDVVRKPQISPKKLTKAEVRSIVSSQEYFGWRLTSESVAEVQTTERENPELYEARLTWDCMQERPQHYFQRRSVPRLDSELMEYGRELWEHGLEMLHARNTNHNARNSGACMLYGSPCKFLGICSGYDTADSDRWVKKTNVNAELPELYGKDGDYITNSRVRCFQTCRRKACYEYDLGIERVDEEEKEALFFGSVWHAGQAAWWSTFLKEPENGDGIDRSASESSIVEPLPF